MKNLGYYNGKYAQILGRVCMDQFLVDVSDIECEIGDEVILIGEQGEAKITMEEFSNSAHSFNYEAPCRIHPRVRRVFIYE